MDGQAEDAKCEDFEKFTVGDDPEKFFLGWGLPTTSREGRTGGVSQEER